MTELRSQLDVLDTERRAVAAEILALTQQAHELAKVRLLQSELAKKEEELRNMYATWAVS